MCLCTGDARWDARMAGWLLWMARHPSPLWSSYLALLPTESEMSCLLNFSQAEAEQLQVPRLKVRVVLLLLTAPAPVALLAGHANAATAAGHCATPTQHNVRRLHHLGRPQYACCSHTHAAPRPARYGVLTQSPHVMLQEEAAIQAGWCAHLHAKYFSTVTGSLAPLRLSDGLAHSLWAISLVRSRTFSGAGAASLTPTASLTYGLAPVPCSCVHCVQVGAAMRVGTCRRHPPRPACETGQCCDCCVSVTAAAEDVNGEMLTLMVPFCDMANHCSDHNSTFCINRDLKR